MSSTGHVFKSLGYNTAIGSAAPPEELTDHSREKNHLTTWSNVDWVQLSNGEWVMEPGTDGLVRSLSVDINLQKNYTFLVVAKYTGTYADGNKHMLFNLYNAGFNDTVQLSKADGDKWTFIHIGNGTSEYTNHDDPSYVNLWTSWVARKTSNTCDLLFNGEVKASETTTVTDMNANLTNLYISSSNEWPGLIHPQILIVNYAMNTAQIRAWHNSMAAKIPEMEAI